MQRVTVYIDGLNLYYGLKSKGWRRYYWLDLRRLAVNLLRPGQRLVAVRYFTARVSSRADDPDKPVRQNTYLEALATLPYLHIHYGHHLPKSITCLNCGTTWTTYEEKMTDVNIAVELLGDAQDDAFDTAIIISADSDLTGPVSAVRQRYPKKRVIVVLPPNRSSFQLRGTATASFTIGRKVLKDSQLPDQVVEANGCILTRPPSWR